MTLRKPVNEYLKRLKNGEKCLEEMFNATSGYIKYLAYKYLVDKSYVSDVVMNTYCKVVDNIQTFNDDRNGMAWICKIAQHEAYAINNRERKFEYVPLEDVSEECASATDDSDNLIFTADMYNAISRLDERDRRIVEMRLFEKMTFKEIADELGMYVGTLYKYFIRSIIKIQEEIE